MRRSAWPKLIGLAAALGALFGWTQLVAPPLASYRTDRDVPRVVGDLATGGGIYGGWVEGWIFILLSCVLVAMAIYAVARTVARLNDYIDHARVDLSMLETKILIYMEDAGLTRAAISREQLFHANNPDVEAYHLTHTPEHGWIDKDSFSIKTEVNGLKFTSGKEIRAIGSGRGIEITEMFSRPLPTGFLATYLPDSVVLYLYRHARMFRKVVAWRTVRFVSTNEYNQDDPIYQIQLLRYPANEVRIMIDFPSETAPEEGDIQVLRLRENVALQVPFKYDPRGARVQISAIFPSAELERLRIRWNNGRLKAYLAANSGPAQAVRPRRRGNAASP